MLFPFLPDQRLAQLARRDTKQTLKLPNEVRRISEAAFEGDFPAVEPGALSLVHGALGMTLAFGSARRLVRLLDGIG